MSASRWKKNCWIFIQTLHHVGIFLDYWRWISCDVITFPVFREWLNYSPCWRFFRITSRMNSFSSGMAGRENMSYKHSENFLALGYISDMKQQLHIYWVSNSISSQWTPQGSYIVLNRMRHLAVTVHRLFTGADIWEPLPPRAVNIALHRRRYRVTAGVRSGQSSAKSEQLSTECNHKG